MAIAGPGATLYGVRRTKRRLQSLGALAVLWFVSGLATTIAAADPALLNQCGVIRAVTAPSSATAGFINLGSRTFQFDMSAGIELSLLPIGQARCIAGPTLDSQIFLSVTVSLRPTSVCGVLTSTVPASGAPGIMGIGQAPELVLKVLPGSALPTNGLGTSVCVGVALDATGDAIYTGVLQLPATSTAPAPESAQKLASLVGLPALVVVALLGVAARRTRRHGRHAVHG
jgi:hypothetical protein